MKQETEFEKWFKPKYFELQKQFKSNYKSSGYNIEGDFLATHISEWIDFVYATYEDFKGETQ